MTHTHTTLTLHLSQVARFGIAAAPKSRYPPTAAPVALLSAAVTQLSASATRPAAFRTSKPIPPEVSRPSVRCSCQACAARDRRCRRAPLCTATATRAPLSLSSAARRRHAPRPPIVVSSRPMPQPMSREGASMELPYLSPLRHELACSLVLEHHTHHTQSSRPMPQAMLEQPPRRYL